MPRTYRHITPEQARRIRLLITDVDGTLTSEDDTLDEAVGKAVRRLEAEGIRVGFASGRTLPRLDSLARWLGVTGPVIAEDGGVARLSPSGPPLELGYSRQPAIDALERLKKLFPGAIRERESNDERLIDVVFFADGIPNEELEKHLRDVCLLDSGFMLHLMQPEISKGGTLMRLLGKLGNGGLSVEETLVVGDSATDLSLFELFPHSVLVPNPRLPAHLTEQLGQTAAYASDLPFGQGFVQVARHIVDIRSG